MMMDSILFSTLEFVQNMPCLPLFDVHDVVLSVKLVIETEIGMGLHFCLLRIIINH